MRAAPPFALLVSAVVSMPLPVTGQVVPDAHTVPGGVLRVSLSPRYTRWDHVFDTSGVAVRLGRFLETDSLGTSLFPPLRDAERAVRTLTGDSTYRMTAGAFRPNLDADVRFIPLRFQVGLTDRITLTAGLPIVSTTMNVTPQLDSSDANVGVHPGLTDQAQLLLADLDAAIADLSARIAAGEFGCPGGASCGAAQEVLDRARATRDALGALMDANPRHPFAPLAGSDAGQAVAATLAMLRDDLTTLGAPTLSDTVLGLPEARADTAGLNGILTDPAYGFAARPFETTKLTRRLGDLELGLRIGLLRTAAMRTVVTSLVRLPTGKLGRTDDLLDLAAGDKQLDLEFGFEAAIEPGNVLALWLGASYNLQFADRLSLRVTSPAQPLAPATTLREVDRDLGDVLRLSAYPSVRLTNRFRVFTTVAYFRKGADRYPGNETLELYTEMERLSYGGGIWYRVPADRSSGTQPIEAGLIYRAAFSGSGGLTPKTSGVEFALRLFYRLWG